MQWPSPAPVCGRVKDFYRSLGSMWKRVGCYLLWLASDPRESCVCFILCERGSELTPSSSLDTVCVYVWVCMCVSDWPTRQPLKRPLCSCFLCFIRGSLDTGPWDLESKRGHVVTVQDWNNCMCVYLYRVHWKKIFEDSKIVWNPMNLLFGGHTWQ